MWFAPPREAQLPIELLRQLRQILIRTHRRQNQHQGQNPTDTGRAFLPLPPPADKTSSRVAGDAKTPARPSWAEQFRPVVARSGIGGAESGVFLETDPAGAIVPRGTVVALYPGLARLHAPRMADPEELLRLPALGHSRHGSAYVAVRESFAVDGSPELLAQRWGAALEQDTWAVGHLVNHPPAGVVPNVALLDCFAQAHVDGDAGGDRAIVGEDTLFDLDSEVNLLDDDEENGFPGLSPTLRLPASFSLPVQFVADWRYESLRDGQRQLLDRRTPLPLPFFQTLSDVADGSELFFNYNLQGALPHWYTPVERESVFGRARRRLGL